ncbi:MAG: hypothetical protein QM538_07040 [Methylacidiphilales bacterium]|nr:hypothetical protein [Candidatus Methylacidiphilales bacterium]
MRFQYHIRIDIVLILSLLFGVVSYDVYSEIAANETVVQSSVPPLPASEQTVNNELDLSKIKTKSASPFIVYPKEVKLPTKKGYFSLPAFEVGNNYDQFIYPKSSGLSLLNWPPTNDPETILDFILLQSSYEYLNGNFINAIEIIDTAIDKNLFNRVSDSKLKKLYINELQRRKSLLYLEYGVFLPNSLPIRVLFNYRQDRVVKNYASNLLGLALNRRGYFSDSISILKNARKPFEKEFGITHYSLLSQALIEIGDYQSAIKVIEGASYLISENPIIQYNLGIAYLKLGLYETGKNILEEVGEYSYLSEDERILAIRDRANLSLAQYFFEGEKPAMAVKYFSAIRSEGPYGNRSLLGLGWSQYSERNYANAVETWSKLYNRDSKNYYVQEVKLSLPHGYYILGQFNRSAAMYDRALFEYLEQVKEIDEVITYLNSDLFYKDVLLINTQSDQQALSHPLHYIKRLGIFEDGGFVDLIKNYSDMNNLINHLTLKINSLESLKNIVMKRNIKLDAQLAEYNKQFQDIKNSTFSLTQRYLGANNSNSNSTDSDSESGKTFSLDTEKNFLLGDYKKMYEELDDSIKDLSQSDQVELQKKVTMLQQFVLSQNYFYRIGSLNPLPEPNRSSLEDFYQILTKLREGTSKLASNYSEIIDSLSYYDTMIKNQIINVNTLLEKLKSQQLVNKNTIKETAMRTMKKERERISSYSTVAYSELRKSIVQSKNRFVISEAKKIEEQDKIEKIKRSKMLTNSSLENSTPQSEPNGSSELVQPQ